MYPLLVSGASVTAASYLVKSGWNVGLGTFIFVRVKPCVSLIGQLSYLLDSGPDELKQQNLYTKQCQSCWVWCLRL